MLANNRLFFLWCALSGGIFFVSILPGGTPLYQFIASYDANRWIHFLVYASAATIPVAAWKPKSRVLLSFVPLILGVFLELLQAHFFGSPTRGQNVPGDLFGMAAGILFGLNLRVMRKSARSLGSVRSDPSGPGTI